jgi:mannan endo-1,4-beta-mannosidase
MASDRKSNPHPHGERMPRPAKIVKTLLATLLITALPALAQTDAFVQRTGTKLTLAGAPFRYSGPNIEWLGLEAYGPHDPIGPRYPTHFEIDDAFATASEMGAKVVRSQTMGDTVGCPLCIEPEEGKFNESAFQATDYALSVARKNNIKLIIPLIGDCATCAGGGIGQYLAWHRTPNFQSFFTDAAIIAAYEKHIDAVLNHLNPITGVRYKDDPTIMAWENCNMCGIFTMLSGGGPVAMAQISTWSETIGAHIKQQDHHHLYLDTTGIFRVYPAIIDNPSTDLVTFEFYPHWDRVLGGKQPPTTAASFSQDAATVTSHGKAFIVNEFGWDNTDWKTPADLDQVLHTLASDPNISGDDFWALQAHLDNFGFQLTPADASSAAFAQYGETGQWWALYYPGVKTLTMSADDMASRAQQLRTHAYAMSGTPVPAHMQPPPPVITATVIVGLIAWRGSAGAVNYSVQRQDPGSPEWKTICDRCATDSDDPWPDPHATLGGSHYRVIAYNADGKPSEPSTPR